MGARIAHITGSMNSERTAAWRDTQYNAAFRSKIRPMTDMNYTDKQTGRSSAGAEMEQSGKGQPVSNPARAFAVRPFEEEEMSNWTPGPWAAYFDHPTRPEDIGYVRRKGASRFEEIAVLYGDDPNRHADAHLIAAAPAMYEALSAIVRVATEHPKLPISYFDGGLEEARK